MADKMPGEQPVVGSVSEPKMVTKAGVTGGEVSNKNNQAKEPVDGKGLVRPMSSGNSNDKLKKVLVGVVVVIGGVLSGYGLSSLQAQNITSPETVTIADAKNLKAGDVFGSKDEDAFPDPAEGVLVKGGIEGEGSHHLLREGGVSRNVYLTSSVLDLDVFVDHRVEVSGETFNAQKAGWLMDVGRVEVIELNAEKPFEEE